MDTLTKTWDERAKKYDSLAWAHNESVLSWCMNMVGLAILQAQDHININLPILEIGCGTGALTAQLARHSEVVACDVSSEMLSRCEKRLQAEGLHGNVTLVQVDPYGVPAGHFSAAISRMVLHHAPDSPIEMLARIKEALTPNCLIMTCEGPPPSPFDSESFEFYKRVMEIKEPGRHVFHTHELVEWKRRLGASRIMTGEMFSKKNSLLGWLKGNVLSPENYELLVKLHQHTPDVYEPEYLSLQTGEKDVLMTWRHNFVAARF